MGTLSNRPIEEYGVGPCRRVGKCSAYEGAAEADYATYRGGYDAVQHRTEGRGALGLIRPPTSLPLFRNDSRLTDRADPQRIIGRRSRQRGRIILELPLTTC
jgi:hypothetical protein